MVRSNKNLYTLILICIVFIVLELIVRFVLFDDKLSKIFYSAHSHYRRIHWYKNNKDIPPEKYFTYMDYDPQLGWKYKPNLDTEYFQTENKMTTNSLGYRNQFEFSQEHENITFLLGDSFVFGDESGDQEIFSSLLNADNKDDYFYNLGVSGYGHDQILITFERYVETYKPKRTILFFNFADIPRNILSFHDYFKPFFTWKGSLKLHTGHIIERKQAIDEEIWRLKIFEILPIVLMQYNYKKYVADMEFITEKILERMTSIAKANNSNLIFVYTPIAYESNVTNDKPFKYEEFMFNFCIKNGLKCYTARDEFKKIKAKTGHVFKEEGHWQELGHKAMYNKVKKILKSENDK